MTDHKGDCTAIVASFPTTFVFQTSGDHSRGVPPVPVPNTEVKPSSADGTANRWESRSSPDVFLCPKDPTGLSDIKELCGGDDPWARRGPQQREDRAVGVSVSEHLVARRFFMPKRHKKTSGHPERLTESNAGPERKA